MPTFAMELKDELTALEMDSKYEKTMLMGMLQVNASINFSSTGLYIDFKSKNEKVANKVFDLIKKNYPVEPILLKTKETKLKKEDIFHTRLEQNAYVVLNDLNVFRAKEDSSYNLKKELESNEEKLAYIRGAFLACGSINDPKSNTYHMEIQAFSPLVAYNLRDLINSFGINSKISENRRGYIIYLKNANGIADFLRIIGSTEGLFYFEDNRIEKDLSNSINRVMNCEIANAKKTQETAKRQIEEIEVVMKYYGERLKQTLVDASKLRLEYKEESLKELEELSYDFLGKTITKSALNHRFREIHNLYLDIKK